MLALGTADLDRLRVAMTRLQHPAATPAATAEGVAVAVHALLRADAVVVAEAGIDAPWTLHVHGAPGVAEAFRTLGPTLARAEAAGDATYGLLVAAEARGELGVFTGEDLDRVTAGGFWRSALARHVYHADGLTYAVGMAVIGAGTEGRVTAAFRRAPSREHVARARDLLTLLRPAYVAGLTLRRLVVHAGAALPGRLLDLMPAEPQPPAPAVSYTRPALTPEALAARHGLTPREAAVALLLAERRTNAEVAASLGMSERTARHHAGRVFAKLGVASRRAVGRSLAAG